MKLESYHPIFKLWFTITVVVYAFTFGVHGKIILLFLLSLLVLLNISKDSLWKICRITMPLIGGIFLLNAFIYPESQEVLDILGIHFKKEGIYFATDTSLRLLLFVFATVLLFSTTPPHLLSAALLEKGLNPKLVYIFLQSIQLTLIFRKKIKTILEAQQSRGFAVGGGLLNRVKGFFPLALPLILSSFTESMERAVALETKGFNRKGKRTSVIELSWKKGERCICTTLIMASMGLLVWKVYSWLVRSL